MGAVRDLFHIACPQCGRDDDLSIAMVVTVHLDPLRGGTVDMNPHGGPDWTWDTDSAAHCYACEHEGTVAEFTVPREENKP